MVTRDILDANNTVIGTLAMPDDTSESVWETTLNSYKEVQTIPDVTPRQIRLAIITSGVSLATVDATIDSLPEPIKSVARIEWEYSIAFQRNRPLVIQLGAMLGFNSAALDALWKLAATL